LPLHGRWLHVIRPPTRINDSQNPTFIRQSSLRPDPVIRFVFLLLLFPTALAAGLCRPLLAAPAFTPIYDAHYLDEPNLIGVNSFPGHLAPSVLETLYGEANLRRIDDRYDIAFRHTGVEATVTTVAHFGGRGGMSLFFTPNRQPLALNPTWSRRSLRPALAAIVPI
jgi:hypothetical protein